MARSVVSRRIWLSLLLLLLLLAVIAPTALAAGDPSGQSQGQWWIPKPEVSEAPLADNGYLYSQIAPKLREIEQASNRVRVEVIGQSAGGRDLFLVTVSDPQALGRLGQYQAIRQAMLKDPERAQELITKFGDFKVPVFINGSIHGSEITGTDACIRLIEKLAFDDSPEVQAILKNEILLFNVVQNPDGRVLGTRGNVNGFDLNRDFITQSQPEVQATVRVIKAWNPMVFLDLHGFVNPMLIEPCTPPHNPNYEYDLYIKWAFDEAKAMEAELFAQTGFLAQIPFRDDSQGWDDWPPIFAPMYAMYHGAYGHTMETPYRDVRGVDAHYAATWGALKFVAENRVGMITDQVEIFKRGFLASLQVPIPQYILDQVPYNQYNELTTIDFPEAYVIPKDAPLQQSPHEARHLVEFLLANDVRVDQANGSFDLNGVLYPKGTYVVWMDQPKRGLANTVLWSGWDISYNPGLTMYDISGWSLPLLWGITEAVAQDSLVAGTRAINSADAVTGAVASAPKTAAYAYPPLSNQAVKATNDLLGRGVMLYRAEAPIATAGLGAGDIVLPATNPNARALANELAAKYGLNVRTLATLPSGLTVLSKQKVAVYADEGVRFILTQLGFDWTAVTTADLNDDVLNKAGYDVFVNSSRSYSGLSAAGKASVQAFIARAGDYVGIGRTGVPFAGSANANLLVFTSASGSSGYNGIVKANYDPADPVSAQYPATSHGFVFGPLWFTSLGSGVKTAATIDSGDFFVSGFWVNWKTSGAAAKPIVVHGTKGTAEVTLIGLDPTFRAHPELTFRLLANAIFNGLD